MDRKEVQEEESVYTEEGELTLKGVGRFIKRAWLRTLIYLLAALVLATVVFAGFRFFGRTDHSVSTTVEFTFRGISSGQNPDESQFNKDDIRSVANVRDAITDAGLTEKVLAGGGDITEVRNRISVTAIMPNEYVQKYNELIADGMNSVDAYAQLSTMQYYPTKFVISLRDFEKIGLNKDETTKLVDSLITTYRDWFVDKYFATVTLSDTAFTIGTPEGTGDASMLDYVDYVDNFDSAYTNTKEYLFEMETQYPKFIYTKNGKSFKSFQDDLDAQESQLSTLRSLVTGTNTIVSNNLNILKSSTQNQIDRLTRELTRLEGLISDTEKQIESIKPTQISVVDSTGNTTLTTAYPQVYYDLHASLQSYSLQKSNTDAQLREKTERMEKIKDATSEAGAAVKAEADSYINAIRTNSRALIAEINEASKENAERNAGVNSFNVISPTAYVTTHVDFPTVFVYLGAAVVAILAGIIVTYALGKRNKARKAAEAKAAAALSKEAPDDAKKE